MNPDFKPPHWSQFLGINFRKLLVGVLLCALAAAGGWVGWQRYQAATRARLIAQAEAFLARNDYRGAALSAREVLRERPNDLRALKAMAAAADGGGSPSAPLLRARVAELEPGRLDNHLDWAASALRMKDWQAVQEALSLAEPLATNSARFHELTAGLALAGRNPQAAWEHFSKAAALEPTNVLYRVNLANIGLQSEDAEAARQARQMLESIARDPDHGLIAVRALQADAKRTTNYTEALELNRRILLSGQSSLQDHLDHLSLLVLTDGRELAKLLHDLQLRVASDPYQVAEVTAWMRSRNFAVEALEWLSTLPVEVQNGEPVPLARAECFIALKRWSQLQAWLDRADWAELDFLRLAFLSRAAREQGQLEAYARYWKAASEAAGRYTQRMFMLARMASGWGWTAESEAVWWAIATGREGRRAALGALHRVYLNRKDERMLLQVAERLHKLSADDVMAANNFAQLSMLQGRNLERAHRLAEANHQRFPSNSVFRSTHAFALYQQGRLAEALQVMEGIPEQNLKHTGMSAYYGLLLAANGRTNEALPHLAGALTTDHLLPTERKLVAEARQRIQ